MVDFGIDKRNASSTLYMKVLAIIPARGGSKGVPEKNKKLVGGIPLVEYALQAATRAEKISATYVSSNDADILKIAERYGCKLHKRPTSLSTDQSPVTDTVRHILELEQEAYDALLILQPTSPLRTGQDIDNAIQLLEDDKDLRSVISVVPMSDIHPARMYKRNEENRLEPYVPEYEQVRRQDIPPAYYRNGCIYLTRTSAFLLTNSLMNRPTSPYIMDFEWLLNIDTPRDLFIAEALIPEWRKHIPA